MNRPYKFTIFLLVANLFVFILMWQSSGLTSEVLLQGFPEPVLIAYGAKLNYLINAPHYQWWRFITPMFIHINLPHLLVNMYSLWMVGPYVEKLYGSAKFIVFWVFTGIAGVVASYLTVRPDLAGVHSDVSSSRTTDCLRREHQERCLDSSACCLFSESSFVMNLPEGFKRAFGTGMLPIIMINLFIGYLGRGSSITRRILAGFCQERRSRLVVNYRRPANGAVIAAGVAYFAGTGACRSSCLGYKDGAKFQSSDQLAQCRR